MFFEYLKRDGHLAGDGVELDAQLDPPELYVKHVGEVGLVSYLASYIFLESGLKPRKTEAWLLLSPGEVKVRGFTIRVWKIFHFTASSLHPHPQSKERTGGRALLAVGTGVPESGNKMGFPLKGLTILGKTRQTLGVEQNPFITY